jgi:hypothetical protein
LVDRNEVAVDRIRRRRDVIAVAAALFLPLGVAAALVPFRSSFANTATALVFVAADPIAKPTRVNTSINEPNRSARVRKLAIIG